MPRQTLQDALDRFLSKNEGIDDISEVINIQNPTEKQLYFFKTMLGWAESNGINPRNLHVDGTIEDVNGDTHESPIDHVPVESKEQLLVLADNDGNLDKILYSKKGTADGRSVIRELEPMEAVNLSEDSKISTTIEQHIRENGL